MPGLCMPCCAASFGPACSIDPQTACSLIPEMLRSGDEMLTGDCVELTTCLDAGQCRQLAESILRHVGLRQMTLMEQNVLANILDELSRSGGVLGKRELRDPGPQFLRL